MDAAVAALIGAGIGALPGIIGAVISSRAEAKRHLIELATKGAITEWQEQLTSARAMKEKQYLPPLGHYLIHWLTVYGAILPKKNLDPADIDRAFLKADEVYEALLKVSEREDPTYKEWKASKDSRGAADNSVS